MEKKYSYAVIIGRFQPFHNGHLSLYNTAQQIAEHIIIVIGSHNAPRSIRNPWNSEAREILIRKSLSEYSKNKFSIETIIDSAYNFNDWLIRIQQKVSAIAGEGKIAIIGHFKDDTSYYLNYFPNWDFIEIPMQADGISSTAIRNAIFENKFENIKLYLHPLVYKTIEEWSKEPLFRELREDYAFIQNYKKNWEASPFPPTFVTANAFVFALGNVLLIKRKSNPAKGNLAVPGGLITVNETIENACIRNLCEQTNIDIGHNQLHSSIKMIEIFDHPLRDPRGRVIMHAFMFELNVKTLPALRAGCEALETFWLPLFQIEKLENLFFNDHSQVIKFFINRWKA